MSRDRPAWRPRPSVTAIGSRARGDTTVSRKTRFMTTVQTRSVQLRCGTGLLQAHLQGGRKSRKEVSAKRLRLDCGLRAGRGGEKAEGETCAVCVVSGARARGERSTAGGPPAAAHSAVQSSRSLRETNT